MPSPTPSLPHTCSSVPSEWIHAHAHLLPSASQVLDVACGSGRHVAYLLQQGHHVTGIDRDAAALQQLPPSATAIQADIENGPWPLPGAQFDALVVTNYLWRPLWPQLLASLRPGGVLLYETFGHGNATFGKPSRPDFLLQPGELLQACQGWDIVAYEHGLRTAPQRVVQRVVAIKPSGPAPALPHLLGWPR